MVLRSKQFQGNAVQIGTINHQPLWQMMTKGGLVVVAGGTEEKLDILGTGSHQAIARHIAKKRSKEQGRDLKITIIEKSDSVDPRAWGPLMTRYEAITDACIMLWNRAE